MNKNKLPAATNSPWNNYYGANTKYRITGTTHRSKEVQAAFAKKGRDTLLLLKKESDNPVDSNAVAVYAALNLEIDHSWQWVKVGYLEASIAKYEFSGLPETTVLEANKIADNTLQLKGRVRSYSPY